MSTPTTYYPMEHGLAHRPGHIHVRRGPRATFLTESDVTSLLRRVQSPNSIGIVKRSGVTFDESDLLHLRATYFENESADALAQAAWDALRILGHDTDGDLTPAAYTTRGYAQLGRTLVETATDVRACYDRALDAMPDEPRRTEPDTAYIPDDGDDPEPANLDEHGYDRAPGQWPFLAWGM